MARPTDPAKLAAYKARQAANSRAYRARKAAEAKGAPVAPEFERKAPARYRPARGDGPVNRAAQYAAELRASRAEAIESLPSARNPAVNIYVPREPARAPDRQRKTKAGLARQAAAIRERARAERLQSIGRARKSQLVEGLTTGPNADRLGETMDREQQRRYQRAAERLAGIPQQVLAVLFEYEGGQGDYNSVHERILGSPESRDVEEGLDKFETLADLGERATALYGPAALRAAGHKTGRLDF